jgi:hypothetical protein
VAPVAGSSENRERERGKGGVELQDGENAERKRYSVSFRHSRKDAGAGSGTILWKQQWDSPVANERAVYGDLDLGEPRMDKDESGLCFSRTLRPARFRYASADHSPHRQKHKRSSSQ